MICFIKHIQQRNYYHNLFCEFMNELSKRIATNRLSHVAEKKYIVLNIILPRSDFEVKKGL